MAYFDHRHSGIDETKILQVIKAVEGEKVLVIKFAAISVERFFGHMDFA